MQILRLGVAQAFVLETPAHAAVATTVDLVAREQGPQMFKGLVNAVLRGLLREPPELDDPDLLAPELALRPLARGLSATTRPAPIAAAIAEEPATDLSLKDPADAAALAAALEAEVLPGGTLRTAPARRHRHLAGLRRGPLVGAGRRRRHPGAPAGRRRPARRRSTSAPRPAARPCSWPPPAPR